MPLAFHSCIFPSGACDNNVRTAMRDSGWLQIGHRKLSLRVSRVKARVESPPSYTQGKKGSDSIASQTAARTPAFFILVGALFVNAPIKSVDGSHPCEC